MKTFGKIIALFGAGFIAASIANLKKKTRNAVCSPHMELLFSEAYKELKREHPECDPAGEELYRRVGEKVRKIQNGN